MKMPVDLNALYSRPYEGLPELECSSYDRDILVTACKRIVLAGQRLRFKEINYVRTGH